MSLMNITVTGVGDGSSAARAEPFEVPVTDGTAGSATEITAALNAMFDDAIAAARLAQ
jgi:hypothetical protein